MSRAHPGQSVVYQEKIKTRLLRENDRKIHKEAMKKWHDKNPGKVLNRNEIKKIKLDIKFLM